MRLVNFSAIPVLVVAAFGFLGTTGCCSPGDPDCGDSNGDNGGGSAMPAIDVTGDWLFKFTGEDSGALWEWVIRLQMDSDGDITGMALIGAQIDPKLGGYTQYYDPVDVSGSVQGSSMTLTFPYSGSSSTHTVTVQWSSNSNYFFGRDASGTGIFVHPHPWPSHECLRVCD